jgi:membrane protein DedA with SNARE-associated domain
MDTIFTTGLVVTFIILIANPYDTLFKTARIQLLKTIEQVMIAPLGKVRFRHFFLADIMTSIASILSEISLMYCILTSDQQQCEYTTVFKVVVGILPFWIRFWQCIRRFKDNNTVKN